MGKYNDTNPLEALNETNTVISNKEKDIVFTWFGDNVYVHIPCINSDFNNEYMI